jgi:hypothetical protein
VIVLDAGEWQARCADCSWKSERYTALADAQAAFIEHEHAHAGEAA